MNRRDLHTSQEEREGRGAEIGALRREHDDLQRELADPSLHEDPSRARSVARRHARVERILNAADRLDTLSGDLQTARELADADPDFAAEAEQLTEAVQAARTELDDLLAPRDPDDGRDVILEIRAGAGGEESALFAAEMLRMYRAYAEPKGWRCEVLDASESDLGGLREVTCSVSSRGSEDEGVYAFLKHEAGVHRVQRVPVTESAGRIHTSAVGVLVLPEADDTDESELLAEQLAPANLRIDVFRSSGPGGQSVNTTDSAVRITHLPTGIVASCQDQKSQLQNREQALRILRARLLDAHRIEQEEQASQTRRSQVRTVDRSERVRTYNFPESRIADHRSGYKANNLPQVLDGALDAVIDSCRELERRRRLEAARAESAASIKRGEDRT